MASSASSGIRFWFCHLFELHVRWGDWGWLVSARLRYEWRHGLVYALRGEPYSHALLNFVWLRIGGWRGWRPVHSDGSRWRPVFSCFGWRRALGAAFGYARLRGTVVLV